MDVLIARGWPDLQVGFPASDLLQGVEDWGEGMFYIFPVRLTEGAASVWITAFDIEADGTRASFGSPDNVLLTERPMQITLVSAPGVRGSTYHETIANETTTFDTTEYDSRVILDFHSHDSRGQTLRLNSLWLRGFGIEPTEFIHEDGAPISWEEVPGAFVLHPEHFSHIIVNGEPSANPDGAARLIGGEIAVWQFDVDDFDKPSAGLVADASGHGLHLIYTSSNSEYGAHGGSLWSTAKSADKPAFDRTGSFTVTAWAKTDSFASSQTFIAKGRLPGAIGAGHWNYNLFYDSSTNQYRFEGSNAWSIGASRTTADVQANEWHHFAGVVDTSAWTARLYIDGVLRGSSALSGLPQANSGELGVGAAYTNDNPPKQQRTARWIDEVRLYDFALTREQIQDIKNLPYNGDWTSYRSETHLYGDGRVGIDIAYPGIATDGYDAFIFGGRLGVAFEDSVDWIQRYNPFVGTRDDMTAKLPAPAYGLGAAVLDGKVYLFDGTTDDGSSNPVLRYDLATDTITTMQSALPHHRWGYTAVTTDSAIYVFPQSFSSIAYRYNPSTDSLTSFGLSVTHGMARMGFFDGDSVYLLGESRRPEPSRIWRFDPLTHELINSGASLHVTQLSGAALSWTGTRAYIIGGCSEYGCGDGDGNRIAEFDPANATLRVLPWVLDDSLQEAAAFWDGFNVRVIGGIRADGLLRPGIPLIFNALPGIPRNLVATSGPLPGAITVHWEAPYDGEADISAYRVYRSADGGPEEILAHVAPTLKVHVDDLLPFGPSFAYRVTALSDAGEGPSSTIGAAAALGSRMHSQAPEPCDPPQVGMKGVVCTDPAPAVDDACYEDAWVSLGCAMDILIGPAQCSGGWCPTPSERLQMLVPGDPVPVLFPEEPVLEPDWDAAAIERDPTSINPEGPFLGGIGAIPIGIANSVVNTVDPQPPPSCYAETTANKACTVLLINGHWFSGAHNSHMSDWNLLRDVIQRERYSNAVRVGFYGGECGTESNAVNHGEPGRDSHKVWFGGDHEHVLEQGCDQRQGSLRHNLDTDFRHLSNHLAWYIFEKYSSKGETVDIVAFSMGGLLVRYALAMVQLGDLDWPDYLLIEDVATLSTPHGGMFVGCFGPSQQARQMCKYSSTIKHMRTSQQNPQGQEGTRWTLVGSFGDQVVKADEAWAMESMYRVKYDRPEYAHTSNLYWRDNSQAQDAKYFYQTRNGQADPSVFWTEHGAHAVEQMVLSLKEGYYCCA